MDDREAEPEHDEPSLGWTRDKAHEGEPSLGTLDRMANQAVAWGSIDPACVSDCELDESDHEDGGNAEPNADVMKRRRLGKRNRQRIAAHARRRR